MSAVLGIDTSCYTTSAAVVDLKGDILGVARRLLTVPQGARGLQQSSGVFQHVQRLPHMIEEAIKAAGNPRIVAVAASTRPRPTEDSYMPVFRVGESQARAAATLLNVPFYPFSHQEGHIRAALVQSRIDTKQPFLALHLSGGTTELLFCSPHITFLGGSLDLHAGQLIDRMGVRMGLGFPAGPALEQLAMKGRSTGRIGVSLRGCSCCIAGAENQAVTLMSSGASREDVAAEIFDFLARTVERLVEAGCAQTGARQALLAGGVASSTLLRQMIAQRARKRRLVCRVDYAQPTLSGDNAVGIALLGAETVETK